MRIKWKFSTPPGSPYPLRGKSIVDASMNPKFRTIFLNSTFSRMNQKRSKIRYFWHVSTEISFVKLKRYPKKFEKCKMLTISVQIVRLATGKSRFRVRKHTFPRLTWHNYALNFPKTHAEIADTRGGTIFATFRKIKFNQVGASVLRRIQRLWIS